MKSKSLNILYDPLHCVFELSVRAGSLLQSHNARTGEYMPDRRLTPVTIEPFLYINDSNGISPSGRREAELCDVFWYIGTEKPGNLIVSGQNGFTVTPAGVITVSRNVPYLQPLQLVCTAKFFDARTGNPLRFSKSIQFSTTSAMENPVTLEIDKPGAWNFDPLTDTGLRTLTATLRLSGKPVTDGARRRFWWYRVEEGAEKLINPEEDLFVESGQDTPQLTVDPRYIPGNVHFRCRAEYVAPDTVAPPQPTAGSAKADTTLTRAYSRYDYDFFVHGGQEVAPGASEIKAECFARSWKDGVKEFYRHFYVNWYLRGRTHGASWRAVGYGKDIFVSRTDYENGAEIGVELLEHEPMRAAAIDGQPLAVGNQILTI